ncbi:TetR/AcrR family transcriptional regulator [Aquabacterium lacunae]|uniref:TetR/AcrR family transcriptional regulator n=1 Tax=Aquabacterium lacunae TaxID=2528630 RepID=A0A4Q9H0U9_9BURK|nr:TetR/AcrR family transcriptional regulator [Aquabacterium lacunae]TBO32758.1 TetR/AcrR family transcriptional regulator [Aquabacterium lacunae]
MPDRMARPQPPSPEAACEPSSPTRQRRKAERPQQLLEAAYTQFTTRGLAATRTEDVAQLAGVSKGTLFRYYPSKDELFKAVIRHYLVEVIDASRDLSDQWQGGTDDLLKMLAHTWWQRFGQSHAAGIFKLIVAEVGNMPELAQFYVDEVITPTYQLVSRAVQRGIDRQEFRPVEVTAVVQALMATAQFLVLYPQCTATCQHNPMPLEPERFMNTQIDLLLSGLRQPPSGREG